MIGQVCIPLQLPVILGKDLIKLMQTPGFNVVVSMALITDSNPKVTTSVKKVNQM
jgi:hypothetical protein